MQQYNEAPLDFLVTEYAIGYPFIYQSDDKMLNRHKPTALVLAVTLPYYLWLLRKI